MTFFVTGASSFVGVELCRYLSDKGHNVIAMSRRENERLDAISLKGKLQVFRADMQSLIEQAKDVKADVFIHLAWAGTSHEERNDSAIHEENLRLSLEYVRLAKRMGCGLYVDAGSQAEYGIVAGPVTEESACNPVTAYGKCKLRLFQETAALTERIGLKYVHLRIFSVYGENDHPDTLIMSSLRKMKSGEPIELRSGGQKWNYLYVKDAARQIAELALNAFCDDSFRQEVFIVASKDTRKLKEFIEAMKQITGSSSRLSFGGYSPEKDVNLDPVTIKTGKIVNPLTESLFEVILASMANN